VAQGGEDFGLSLGSSPGFPSTLSMTAPARRNRLIFSGLVTRSSNRAPSRCHTAETRRRIRTECSQLVLSSFSASNWWLRQPKCLVL
jgi:hypothetical protein